MRRSTLLPTVLLAVAAAAGAGDAEDAAVSRRVDSLLERWRTGDAAARAGVVAETRALGDAAVAALFRRLAPNDRPDFPGTAPGVRMSEEQGAPRADLLVSVQLRVGELEGDAPAAARIWSGEELAALEGKVQYVTAPRLTVYDGQRANVSVLRPRSYVRTYDAAKAPVEGVVQSGLVVDLRPRVLADGKTVSLELKCVHSRLAEPMAKLATPAGEIELPVVDLREAALTLDVADGARRVVALPATGERGALVVSVETAVTRLEDVDLDFPGQEIELK